MISPHPVLRDIMYRANMYRYGPKGIAGQNVSPMDVSPMDQYCVRRLNGYCYARIAIKSN